MSDLTVLRGLVGDWTGQNQVLLPGEPPHVSDTTATLSQVVGGKCVQFAYTWAFDGSPHEGLLLIVHEAATNSVTAVWFDTWHVGDKCMVFQGEAQPDGTVNVLGSYSVEGSAEWGWRIIVEPSADALRIHMYNIMPEGDEFLGVEMNYRGSQ